MKTFCQNRKSGAEFPPINPALSPGGVFCARSFLVAALMLFAGMASAENIRLYFPSFTNSAVLLTNTVKCTPISGNILSSGGVIPNGTPINITFPSSGVTTQLLTAGYWSLTNNLLGSSGIVIRVWDDSTDVVDYTNRLWGGYNKFVTSVVATNNASAGSATNVFFLASTNITPSVSGGSNVFTVTGQVPLATVAVTATNGPSGYRLDDGIAITNILDSKYNYLGVVPVSLSGGGPGGFGLKASQYGTNWATLKMQTSFTTTNKFFTPAVGYLSNTWIVAYDPFSVWSTPTKVWAVTTSTNLVDWSPSLFVTNTQSTAQRVYIDHFFTDPDTGELFLYQSGESGITHCAKVGNTTGTNYGSWFPVETAANLGLYDASVVKWNGVYYMVGSTPVSTFEVYTNVTSATNTFRLWRADSSFTSTAMESPQIVQIGSNVHRIFGQMNPSGIQKTYFFDVTNMNIPSTLPWKEVQEDGITGGRMDVQLVTGEQKRQLQSVGESLVDAQPYSFIIYTNTTPSVRSVTLPSVYIGGGTAAKITWEVTAVSAKTNTSPINLADAAFFKLEQYEYMMGGIPFFGSMPMGNFILREVARPGGYNSNDWYAVVSHTGFSSTDHYYTNGPQLVLTGPTNGAVTWKVRTTVDPTTFSLNSLTTSGTIGRWSESNVVNTTFYPNVVVSDTLTRSNASIRDGASDNYLGAITENVTAVRTQNIGSSILKIVEDAGGAITYWDYSDDALNPKAFFQYTTFLGDAAAGPYVAARKIFGTNIYGGGANITGLNADNIASGTVAPARLGSGSSITTKYLRGDSTWQTISGGGDALTSGNLSQFASTTSAQLRGVLSDESGTGVFLTANGDGSALTGLTAGQIGPSGAVSNNQSSVTLGTVNSTSNNISGGISAGSLTATSITNSGGTASRIVIHDANKKLIGATASGAVPIDADGTATTFAQINSLGNVITTNAATLTSSTFLVGDGARGASAQAGYTTSTVATNPPMAGAWAGPTNTLAMKPNGEYPVYPTATDCAITNLSNGNGWATVGFSNSSASTIVVRLTDARIRIIGPASTNALNIPSGKVGFVSGLVNTWTNAMTGVQQ